MSISQRIKKVYELLLEKERVSSTEDFAKQMGYTQPQISNVFSDKRNAGPKLLQAIIDTYSVSESYLINGKGEVFKTNSYTNTSPTTKLAMGVGEAKQEITSEFAMETIRKCQEQIDKSQEQIDRLIDQGDRQLSIIESLSGQKMQRPSSSKAASGL